MGKAKVKWGVLSTAKIGIEKVVPAMQKGAHMEIIGIASRDKIKARKVAKTLGIPKYYDSYNALISDPEVEAIYNPLPNHLHYEWTKEAIQHGKHVLCEKPLTLKSHEIRELMILRDAKNVKVGEAFMVRTHPQWIDVAARINRGELGKLRAIHGFFSYYKTDPENIRNIFDYGGGAMWDIGCYPVHIARFILGEEPQKVLALVDRDPELKIDRLASVLLDFPSGQCNFTVSTQLVPHQSMIFYGEQKKIEVDIPFNAPNDRKCKLFIDGGDLYGLDKEEISFDVCDQYTVQGEEFSNAILRDGEVPVSLENALGNVAAIEAIFESERTGNWVEL
ncbi:MAG: Gfo/Idh/MocA family oxidoreductase [Cytophagales bacterium]|nr:Gfo/Idh/MocA family oxidoreductase [Cytophagales bacterium]